MPPPVILSAVRTPYGRVMGRLARMDGPSLGALAAAEALRRIGLEPREVERVYLGNAAAHGFRGNPAAAAWRSLAPDSGSPCVTVRAGCASGLLALEMAADWVAGRGIGPVLAGGFESSSTAPHLATGLRRGLRLGGSKLLDAARHDGPVAAAVGSESSHEAFLADGKGREASPEIMKVTIPGGRKGPVTVDRDEVDGASEEGTVPEDRPLLADGAAALIVASADWARARNLEPLATLAPATFPPDNGESPFQAVEADLTEEAAEKLGESLSSGTGASINPAGGHALLGHATGADGARLVVSLVHRLRREGGGRGFAVAAGGWNEAAAALIEI